MQEVIFSHEAIWFFMGVIVHKIGSALLGYGKIGLFARDIILNSLELLVSITQDVAYMQQLKYLQMAKDGVPDEKVELAKKMDKRTIDSWKSGIVNKFITTYPRQLGSVVRFRTWSGALKLLEEEWKKSKI